MADVSRASSLNRAEALLLKSNLILQSTSSLYDRIGYNRNLCFSNSYSSLVKSDDCPVSQTPVNNSVISKPLLKFDISSTMAPKSSQSERRRDLFHSMSLGSENNRMQSSKVDGLTSEQYQQLHKMLYLHFSTQSKNSSNESDLVPAGYNEEDPHTWPSNWLSQAPTMILDPETYLAQKPLLNEYQQNLIRRISVKYEPLVQHYRQQIVNASNYPHPSNSQHQMKNIDSNNNERRSSVPAASCDSNGYKNDNPAKQQKWRQLSVKPSEECVDQDTNESNNSAQSNKSNANMCIHDKCSTTIFPTDSDIEMLHCSASVYTSNIPYRQDDYHAKHISSHATVMDTKKIPEQNRLSRLSSSQLNKWSNKMKVYLRKN